MDDATIAELAAKGVRTPQGGMPAEIPRYRCHKEVRALQIGGGTFRNNPDGTVTLPLLDGGSINVERSVVHRYFPQPGDYLVIYDDAYRSISPRAAFESGYTRRP